MNTAMKVIVMLGVATGALVVIGYIWLAELTRRYRALARRLALHVSRPVRQQAPLGKRVRGGRLQVAYQDAREQAAARRTVDRQLSVQELLDREADDPGHDPDDVCRGPGRVDRDHRPGPTDRDRLTGTD